MKKVVNTTGLMGSLVSILLISACFAFAQQKKCPNMEAMLCEGIPYSESLRCDPAKHINTKNSHNAARMVVYYEGIPHPDDLRSRFGQQTIIKVNDSPSAEEMHTEGPTYRDL